MNYRKCFFLKALDLGFFLPKETKVTKHQKMPGGLLFWILYCIGLEAFRRGTLCERVPRALFVRVVVKMLLLESLWIWEKHQKMLGGLLFWILYYFGLEAFKGGILGERAPQALFVRAIAKKMLLLEGFGFGIFL